MIKKLVAAMGLVCLSSTAMAGVIRHDVSDDIYKAIGSNPAFNSVGAILFDTPDGGYICSGTAISSNWILTAAHCVDEATSMTFYQYNGSGMGHTAYQASRWFAHESWTGDLLAGWDIGLMYVKDALTVPFAKLYEGASEFLSIATHVGYGATGTGETGSTLPSGERRGGQNIIDDQFSTEGNGDHILFSDFDHPTNPLFNALDFDGYTFDDLAIDYEYSIAGGDSGGGLFIEENGEFFLAGVHSLGFDWDGNGAYAGYGDVYGSTRVSTFVDWINARAVPEPGTISMFALALGMLLMGGRRKALSK
ncbi:hypothetical protein GCM10009092_42190 [Bowmanella denitrificans]|uniref:Serine protease n=1 Tax=Bowmanella denitrificans TaxID=366582 RepID=A0ABN0XV08_9ALTE